MLAFIQAGEEAKRTLRTAMAQPGARVGPLREVAPGAPFPNGPKLLCVAANFREHILECGFDAPKQGQQENVTPQFFAKFPSSCVIGPGAPISVTSRNVAPDWELELAVVLGRRRKRIPKDHALKYVFGYTVINDVSERKLNSTTSFRLVRANDNFFDWLNGKWFDWFAPLGPAIVTADEIPDPQNQKMRLEVNGEIIQDSTTANMISPVAELIAYISEYVTLERGDLIATGTPEGVGMSRGRFLRPGDVVTGWIEEIGYLENRVVAESAVVGAG